MTRPLIIAHRGSSTHAPENTLLAFERALREQADGIELDVWQCASGEIVVTHNRDTALLTGTPGNVEKMSLSELRQLDFGQGEKIPTLEQVLDLIGEEILLNIEIKGSHFFDQKIEMEILRILRKQKRLEKTLLSSFNPLTLFRVRRLELRIPLGLLFKKESALPLRRAWAATWLRPTYLNPSHDLLTPKQVQRWQQKGQKVIAWTINHIHDLETCTQCGVDAMITDDPAWCLEKLQTMRIPRHAPSLG